MLHENETKRKKLIKRSNKDNLSLTKPNSPKKVKEKLKILNYFKNMIAIQ